MMVRSVFAFFLLCVVFFSCSNSEEEKLRAKISEEATIVQKDSRELSETQISQYKDLELAANKEYIKDLKVLIDSSFEKQLGHFEDEELGVIAGYKYMFKYIFMNEEKWTDLQIQLGDRYFNSLNTEQTALQLSLNHAQKVKDLRIKYKGIKASTAPKMQVLNLPNSNVYLGSLINHSRNNVAIEIGTTILDYLLGLLLIWIVVNIIGYAITGPVGCGISIVSFVIMVVVSVCLTHYNDNSLLESLRQQKQENTVDYNSILYNLNNNTAKFYEAK
ncbi:hypothetical protein I6E49_05555 [Prevotella stercorea]|jgi:hypothetical protein|uniref:hypothetical protein n=1 Tax=Leyella stercorea TaxID=363265 RepID=UPI001F3A7BED|nr:hypothetical protein [Leyella stercorea]MCF2644773.1 hypothetical protein [Leyella stercorea]